jgi:peptide/nickel transport system substrate-binding protein
MKKTYRRAKIIALLAAILLVFFAFLFFRLMQPSSFARGDRYYGGVFSYSLPEKISSLFPQETNALSELRIISQLFDPLVKQSDSKGTIENYLAKSIDIQNQGKLVRIKLRRGVLFNDDDCFSNASRELTAEDVAFTFSLACSNHPLNQSGTLLIGKIGGSVSYFKNGIRPDKSTVSGIRIINPYELEIQLTRPYNNFKQLLAHPSLGIISKVSWSVYGDQLHLHPVGSGPFFIQSMTDTILELARNKHYWRHDEFGNQLPYLDEVHILTNTKLTKEYPLFSEEKVDLLFDLPVNDLEKAFGTLTDAKKGKNLLHRVHIQKASKIHYLAWNLNSEPFKNPLVRKAFQLAINKDYICSEILRGDGQALNRGFIPASAYYSNPNLELIQQDLIRARNYLKEAGYDEKNPFPTVSFLINNQKGSNADLWCKDVCRQLKTGLGIDLRVEYVGTKERDYLIKTGKAQIWKTGWVGDYPDAESYLRLFFQEIGETNTSENYFYNSTYNRLYLNSILTSNKNEKLIYQRACEEIIARENAILPIYSEDFFMLINLRVRGFEMNPSGIIDFSQIYLKSVEN